MRDRGEPFRAPHPNHEANVRRLAGDEWAALRELQVETRDPKHPEAAYRLFAARQIDG